MINEHARSYPGQELSAWSKMAGAAMAATNVVAPPCQLFIALSLFLGHSLEARPWARSRQPTDAR